MPRTTALILRPHAWLTLVLAALMAATLPGCTASRPGTQPFDPTLPVPGYDRTGLHPGQHDLSALRGRRIVLDPGHGGRFRGAVGPNGLTEAEVNLGVALHLRGLLEWAGAEVHLTRTADNDLLTAPDSSLASDLKLRVDFTNALQPDVFISIHHNSTANLDRTINETQTYYPLTDDGASLDLARSVHRHLVTRLGITPASIRPGNFHVLRGVQCPAILGEPAMISHPVMAERLSLAASQRLEAEAYLLGLADYFQAGRPAWGGAATDTIPWLGPEDPAELTWVFTPDRTAASPAPGQEPAGPGPDPGSIRLTLDGQEVTPRLSPDARTVTWRLPADLAPRPHVLELQSRNLAGRATPRRRTVLLPRLLPCPEVTLVQEQEGRWTGVAWSVPAGLVLPVGDLVLASGRTLAVAPDLPRAAIPFDLPASDFDGPIRFRSGRTDEPGCECRVSREQLPGGRRLHLPLGPGAAGWLPDGDWRQRLPSEVRKPFVVTTDDEPVWLESPGVHPVFSPGGAEPGAGTAGRGTVNRQHAIWPLSALVPGLLGKVIVLDPRGGGTTADGIGPLGLRGADLNLATARRAANLLRGAGAIVHLTRTDETELPAPDKIRLATRVGADLFLTIARAGADGRRRAWYHPGSRTGQAWAAAAQLAAGRLPGTGPHGADLQIGESAAYLLRHTACPALEWHFDPALTVAAEWRQDQPGWARAEARAILMALVHLEPGTGEQPRWLDVPTLLAALQVQGGLPPDAVQWARLDGNLDWSPLGAGAPVAGLSDSLDSGSGPGLPALLPRHVLEIHAGDDWQVWQLDARTTEASVRWQPTLLLSGPSVAP